MDSFSSSSTSSSSIPSSSSNPTAPSSSPLTEGATTYEYGTLKSIESTFEEIEQAGQTPSSLLVTRGHVELEIFLQPLGAKTPASSSDTAPLGQYTDTPIIRDDSSTNPRNTSSSENDDNTRNITLNSQLELDFSGKLIICTLYASDWFNEFSSFIVIGLVQVRAIR